MKSPREVLRRLWQAALTLFRLRDQLDEIKVNQGIILSTLNSSKSSNVLLDYEFKVFSQWGEDGIIQHLIRVVEIKHQTFIEFGIEDFRESNCRFLMVKDNWSGFVIDGSRKNIESLMRSNFYHRYEITAVHAFITRDNINDLLSQSGFPEDLGILSIDVDGNDYYILESITTFRPRILICEYNAVFGGKRKISTPYQADFLRSRSHFSNLYFGASLAALEFQAKKKGYSLVGTNSARGNAFFVRNDLINEKLRVFATEEIYAPSKFREARDENGHFSMATGEHRLGVIAGLPVFNVETETMEDL